MARRVDTLPPRARRGRKPIYPWHRWLDGNIWELEPGKDYTAPSFHSTVRLTARRRGGRARVEHHHGKLYIQYQEQAKPQEGASGASAPTLKV